MSEPNLHPEPPRQTFWRRISPLGWVVAVLVLLALGVSGWQNYRQLRLIEKALQDFPEGLDVWDLAQMQKELLGFKNAVDVVVARGTVDDPDAVLLQWELVWSRLNVVTQSATGKALRRLPPSINRFPELMGLIEEIDADFPTLLKHPAAVAGAIQERMAKVLRLSQKIFAAVYNYELVHQSETRELLKSLHLRHIGITVVFVALFFALLVVVYKSFRSELGQAYQLLGRLGRSEERYRTLIDSSLQGFLVHRDYKPLYANQALADVFGYESAEELRQLEDVRGLLSPEERSRMETYYQARVVGDVAPSHYSFRGVKKDGTPIIVETIARQIEWEEEPAVQVVMIDMTQRERADALKREFIATVSHELRTPLTAIVGSLGLVQKGVFGKIPASIKEMLHVASRNCERLVRLVNDILDIHKIETGNLEYRMEVLEVGELLRHAIEVNQAFADQYGVKFRLDDAESGAEEIAITADRDRIMQVLTNLMANAAMHSPKGGRVELAYSRRNGSARVEVHDQGPGIPASLRGRIFEKFAQSNSSEPRKSGGSGLGLSICKALVENHGGRIGYASRPGGGTTFFFELPELTGAAKVEALFSRGTEDAKASRPS